MRNVIVILTILPIAAYAATDQGFHKVVQPFFDSWCSDCHMDGEAKGDLDLDAYTDVQSLQLDVRALKRISDAISSGEMPPKKRKRRPPATEEKAILNWLDTASDRANVAAPHSPGRPILRRLNRTELGYALEDLLGVNKSIADDFPNDDTGYGFDTYGPALGMASLHAERWLAITQAATSAALPDARTLHMDAIPVSLEQFVPVGWARGSLSGDGLALVTNGAVTATIEIPAEGTYQFDVTVIPAPAGDEPPKFRLAVGEREIATRDVTSKRGTKQSFTVETKLNAGPQLISFSFLNDFWDANRAPGDRDRNLTLNDLKITGPTQPTKAAPGPAHRKLSIPTTVAHSNENEIARNALVLLARRAWRRPMTKGEMTNIARLYKASRKHHSFRAAIRRSMAAILTSQNFLFRLEPPPSNAKPGNAVALTDHQLATRLALTLWRSTPDDELLREATANRLRTDKQVVAQVRRMLADEKGKRFASDFCGQWLMLHALDDHQPNTETMSYWSSALVQGMKQETEMLFLDVLRKNRALTSLLDAETTWLTPQLAHHYGVKSRPGPSPVPEHRIGILSHASILTLTSHPGRNSPVRRGKFVLDQLLGMSPPPPPPDTPVLDTEEKEGNPKTIREALERHRNAPECSNCHRRLDPPGFALDNFDFAGRFLPAISKETADTSATMIDGTKIDGLHDLVAALKKDEQLIVRTFIENFLVFSLGRAVTKDDYRLILSLTRESKRNNHGLGSLIESIVLSDAFRKQQVPARVTKPAGAR